MFKPTTSSSTRRIALTLAILPALLLGACVTPPGATFTQLEATPPGQANLYLYRKAALYAFGAKFAVADVASKKPLGHLFNASYLVLPLNPGKHQISVDEGGFQAAKVFDVQAEPGKNYFVEYDSSKGLLLGWGLLSGSATQTEAQALADLKELKRAN